MVENNKNLFSHGFGGYKSEIKVSAEPYSSEILQKNLIHISLLASAGLWQFLGSFGLWLRLSNYCYCPHTTVFPLHVSLYQNVLLIQTQVILDLASTLIQDDLILT